MPTLLSAATNFLPTLGGIPMLLLPAAAIRMAIFCFGLVLGIMGLRRSDLL